MNNKRISIFTKNIETAENALYMLDIYEFEIVDDFEKIKAELEESAKYWDFIDEDKLKNEIGQMRIVLYGDDDLFNIVKDGLKGIGAVSAVTCEDFADEDWINSWKRFFTEIEVNENIAVVPYWQEEVPRGKTVIRINPGMIFGTGSHETTRLCLNGISEYLNSGDSFLDLGCGSGILAIGALLLGAKDALCIDIEENAPKAVLENAKLNEIDCGIEVLVGDLIEDAALRQRVCERKYDFIAANIVAGVIIEILPLVKECMAKDGTFICSGIIDEKREQVKKALLESGFEIINESTKDKWTAFTAKLRV